MSFASDIERFVRRTGITMNEVLRKLAFDGYEALLRRSPVDQGRFRASWRVGVNHFDLTVEPEFEEKSGVEFGDPLRGDEHSYALDELASVDAGDTIHLTNNLPYAVRLNSEGHSKQNTEGILEPALEEIRTKFVDTLASV
jgi:hypothetical protein